jgi:hypothetical protein
MARRCQAAGGELDDGAAGEAMSVGVGLASIVGADVDVGNKDVAEDSGSDDDNGEEEVVVPVP